MKVWRAIGGGDYVTRKPQELSFEESGCHSHSVMESGAIFVAPDELQALAWAIALDKYDFVEMEVSCIRDRSTLEVIEEFTPSIVYITVSGRKDRYREIQLHEAVVLPGDVL